VKERDSKRRTELIEYPLPTGTVPVDIARYPEVDVVVGDSCINHGFHTSLVAHLGVVDLAAGLDELCDADAEDVDWLDRHFGIYSIIWGGIGIFGVCILFFVYGIWVF